MRRRLPGVEVVAVTGALPQEERVTRVSDLAKRSPRVLVATDCLSEGINLQDHFDAVIHYDLSWNPTRHEQREGRVDRYGQPRPEVRTVLLYGEDNKIDGVVLNVLLRKAESIRKSLGVSVPLPTDSTKVMEAVFEALLLRRQTDQYQLALPLGPEDSAVTAMEAAWDNATEREKRSRTIYAQASLRPEDVLRELREVSQALGNHTDVERFVCAGAERLGAPAERIGDGRVHINMDELPIPVREMAGLSGHQAIAFQLPVPDDVLYVARTHPLVESLGSHIAGSVLDSQTKGVAARCAALRTKAVTTRTNLLLLRLRVHLEITRQGITTPLLAEECLVTAFEGRPGEARWLHDERALDLLDATPSGSVPAPLRQRWLEEVLDDIALLDAGIGRRADERAASLMAAHRRVRDASGLRDVRYAVRPHLPVDVLGLYVLMPVAAGVAQA